MDTNPLKVCQFLDYLEYLDEQEPEYDNEMTELLTVCNNIIEEEEDWG